jgi:hypothetical protein
VSRHACFFASLQLCSSYFLKVCDLQWFDFLQILYVSISAYHLKMTTMSCRDRCGACCIAPSISSAIPGMPHGKPAGVRCIQLDQDNRCRIFSDPRRPAVCASLQPSPEMCGTSGAEALSYLERLERITAG